MRNTRKILVALLVLMTLMVGAFAVTASAAAGQTWTVAGVKALCGTDWDTANKNNDMTYDSATDSYVKVYENVKAGTYQFKCAKDHKWDVSYGNGSANYNLKVDKDGSTVTITLKGTTVTAKVEAPACDHKYEVTSTTVTCLTGGNRTWTCSVCGDSYTEEKLDALGHSYDANGQCVRCDATTTFIRVYVNNAAKWANVYCYTWDTNPYVAWPGAQMAIDEATGYYYYDIPENFVNVIFNNGGSTQSADLKTPTGKAVVYNNSTKAWSELHTCSFSDATCTEPAKCECGKTQGEALGHTWDNATCEAPKTCSVCKVTEGEALGHNYVEGVCSACNAPDPDYVAPEQPEEEEKKVNSFESSALTATAAGTYAEDTVVEVDGYFSLILGAKSKIDSSSKTWKEDDWGDLAYKSGQRLYLGGKTTTTANAIVFTTNKAAIITVWWVSNGDPDADGVGTRPIGILNEDGEIVDQDTTGVAKNAVHVSVLKVNAAGKYYLGNMVDNNFFFKVVVEEVDCVHEFEENVFFHPELVAADCCHTGVAVFECIHCDYYYTEETPADPEAHGFWGDREVITEANCVTKTNGLEKVYCANGCGQYNEVEVLYSEVHNWDVQKETYATCTEAGEYYAVCTLCGEVDSYSVEANGHYNWFLTCGQTGECMECGVEFTKDHSWYVSCTEAAFCTDCFTEGAAAPGHTYVLDVCLVCYDIKPSYQIGENAITNGTTNGAFGMFVVEEAGTYWVVSNNGSIACIFTTPVGLGADFSIAADGTLGASWYVFSIMPVELQPGLYYAAGYGIGDYTLTIMRHDEHTFVEGKCACGAVDPDYVPPHEHSFVEGKCECGEVDPNYTKPEQPAPEQPAPEQPAPEQPAPEQPAPELSLFEKIMQTINEFIAKITAWFKSFVAGLKK